MYQSPARLVILVALCLLPSEFLYAQNTSNPNIRVITRGDWIGQPKYRPDELLVRFRPGTSLQSKQAVHLSTGASSAKTWASVDGLELVRLPVGSNLQSAIAAYRQNTNVLYAEPNFVVHALAAPNDTLFPQQWSLANTGQFDGLPGADIHVEQAWTQTTGSSSVVVAVIDTGIDYNHPDLAANVWSNSTGYSGTINGVAVNCAPGTHGFNAVAENCDPMDDNGHGSHVSGTIGAVGNNGIGVVGVNWNAQILPCKFLDAQGSGSISQAITCLDFVKAMKDRGANIVATNNSWGGLDFSQSLEDAIQAQQQDGILFIAAAGNDFSDNDFIPLYPADFFLPNLISVASTDRFDHLAYFSDYGLHSVHLAAPGQEILSTTPNSTYAFLSGTSMAAPHVTGVAALLAAFNPKLDWRGIKNLLLAGGDTLPTLASTVTGKRLNAYGALSCTNSTVTNRLQPAADSLAGTTGQPITLAVLNINCAQPAGPMQVSVSPGGQIINLVDDGSGADQAAGDGIYTAQWTPSGIGTYILTFPTGNPVEITILNNYGVGESNSSYVQITGTNLDLGDDEVAAIASPFPVQFGGGAFSRLYVSSNGTVSFTNAYSDYVNIELPVNIGPLINPQNSPAPAEYQPLVTLLAPFWEDLFPVKGSDQNVFWAVTGTAPNRELVVEWRNVRAFECRDDSTATVTFEAVFPEGSSNFYFNYADMVFGQNCSDQNYGAIATVGVQVDQVLGTVWSFETPSLNAGTSLEWTLLPPNPAPNPAPTVTSVSPSSVPPTTDPIVAMLTGSGFIPDSQVVGYPTTYISGTQLQVLLPPLDPPYAAAGASIALNVTNPPPGGGGSQAVYLVIQGVPAQITSISPASIPAGSFGFTLTINGSGFSASYDGVWNGPANQYVPNGIASQVIFISPSQVQMVIPDTALLNPGTATVQIQTGQYSFSNSVSFTITPAVATAVSGPGPGTARPQPASGPPPVGASYPSRFLGWNYAKKIGGSYLDRFIKPMGPSGPAIHNSRNARETAPSVASSQSALTPLAPPGFNFRPTLPAGSFPSAVATGDFNRDGKLDWAVANAGDNTIWIYLGNGDGSFQTPAIISLRGFAPVALVAADMNHDGILDLIVAEVDSGMVAVLLGNGDGTFAPELQFAAPNPPISLAVADFDGDGNQDVVVGVLDSFFVGQLAFFRGDGTGKLSYPEFRDNYISILYLIPNSLSVADLDRDGLPDLIVQDFSFDGFDGEDLQSQDRNSGVWVYHNEGNGTFKVGQHLFSDQTLDQTIGVAGVAATAVAIGDVNNDGCTDAVVLDTTGTATFLPGKCDGTFDTSHLRLFGTGIVAGTATLIDVNGDGKLDLVGTGINLFSSPPFSASDGQSVSVMFGDGTGNFGPAVLYRGESGVAMATEDLNGDGHLDLITANQSSGTATVYINDGQGHFGGATGNYNGYLAGGREYGDTNPMRLLMAAADVNGDGHKDLVVIEAGNQAPMPASATVMLGDGKGGFGSPLRSPLIEFNACNGYCLSLNDFALADFRNTGRPDLLLLAYTEGANPVPYLALAKNNGDGTFQRPVNTSLSGVAHFGFTVGDFNGDGKLDVLFVYNAGSFQGGVPGTIQILPYFGNGDGTFSPGPITNISGTLTNGGPYLGLAQAVDLNHDGKLDLLVTGDYVLSSNDVNALYELVGNGDGTFQAPKLLLNNFSEYFTVADLNHDGLPDLVEGIRGISDPDLLVYLWKYQVYLGQPDGTFQPGSIYGPYPNPRSDGNFGGPPNKPVQPAQPLLADFNGDGNLDLLAVETGTDIVPTYFGSLGGNAGTSLQVLLGNGDGTFTPSDIIFGFGASSPPQLAVDLNGDNRADLVEVNEYSSSFDVISATAGSNFTASLVGNPIVGNAGAMRIVLAVPQQTTTSFAISSSDPKISVPSAVSIPAGSTSLEVPFQVGSGANPNKLIVFTVSSGAETHPAYGTLASPAINVGFVAAMATITPQILPTESTPDYSVLVGSTGSYRTTVQFSCQGLPTGASCQFGADSLALGPDQILGNSLYVNTNISVPYGTHSFSVVLTDGFVTRTLPGSFTIGDFSMSITPSSQSVGPNDYVFYTLSLESLYGYTRGIQITCSGLPTSVSCASQLSGYMAPGPQGIQFNVVTQNAPPGTYTFTLTGVSAAGTVSHSASAQLIITSGSFTGSSSISSATIPVGGSQSVDVNLSTSNGFQGQVNLSCSAPEGITCQFVPNPATIGPSRTGSSRLTVAVSAKPAFVFPRNVQIARRRPGNFPSILTTAFLLALMLVAALALRINQIGKTSVALIGATVFVLLILSLSSCAGGNGTTSGSSGGVGGGSQPITTSVTVQGTVGGTTVNVCSLSITVP